MPYYWPKHHDGTYGKYENIMVVHERVSDLIDVGETLYGYMRYVQISSK